jgi:hypothetical protein
MELFHPYNITLLVSGLTGLMMLIQFVVADVVAIKEKHTPGYPVKSDHDRVTKVKLYMIPKKQNLQKI